MGKAKLTTIKKQWDDGYKEGRSRRPKIDLSKQINRMAQIVVRDIKDGLNQSKDIGGSPFKPLSSATIKRKKKKGYPKNPLIGTGTMQKVYIKDRASKSKQSANVIIPKTRQEVGFYHNEGKGNLPEREWFGVGARLKGKLDKYVKKEFSRILKIK